MKPFVPGEKPAIMSPTFSMPAMPSGFGRKPWIRLLIESGNTIVASLRTAPQLGPNDPTGVV